MKVIEFWKFSVPLETQAGRSCRFSEPPADGQWDQVKKNFSLEKIFFFFTENVVVVAWENVERYDSDCISAILGRILIKNSENASQVSISKKSKFDPRPLIAFR
jgi:hypothetical protein